MQVAALYIDPRGPYPTMPDIEPWGLPDRDAKTYPGPHPIIAHPPCGPWGRLRHFVKPGNSRQDKTCAPFAIAQVRRFGGVLEHPAGSLLWPSWNLPAPGAGADRHGGWTLELDQCRFGHVCRKRTWLYVVGIRQDQLPPLPPCSGPNAGVPTHWCGGGRRHLDALSPARQVIVPAHMKVASAELRRRTPIAFANYLAQIARRCGL
jgi:hypothetical protein